MITLGLITCAILHKPAAAMAKIYVQKVSIYDHTLLIRWWCGEFISVKVRGDFGDFAAGFR